MKARFCWFVLALMMVKSICAMEYVGARSGEMTFIWNESLLDELGLRAPHNTVGLEDNSTLRLRAEEGHLLGLADGYMALQEGLQLRNERDDLLATGLRLRAKGAGYFAAVITDSEGNEWFTLDHGHPLLDKSTSRLTWRYLDLRIGRDLAQRLGRRALRGQPIASVHIQIQLQNALSKPKALAACLNPVWPNPPQSYADVQLSDMAAVDYLADQWCLPHLQTWKMLGKRTCPGIPSTLANFRPTTTINIQSWFGLCIGGTVTAHSNKLRSLAPNMRSPQKMQVAPAQTTKCWRRVVMTNTPRAATIFLPISIRRRARRMAMVLGPEGISCHVTRFGLHAAHRTILIATAIRPISHVTICMVTDPC
jgi:hypothetical protein